VFTCRCPNRCTACSGRVSSWPRMGRLRVGISDPSGDGRPLLGTESPAALPGAFPRPVLLSRPLRVGTQQQRSSGVCMCHGSGVCMCHVSQQRSQAEPPLRGDGDERRVQLTPRRSSRQVAGILAPGRRRASRERRARFRLGNTPGRTCCVRHRRPRSGNVSAAATCQPAGASGSAHRMWCAQP
jgi:hypothetical protein